MRGTLAVNNELIRRRRKRNVIKRAVITFVLLIAVLVTLCLKLSYFNVQNIGVGHNKLVSSEDVITLSKIYKGNNIFYINTNKVRTNLFKNPYILDAAIKRKLPNSILIDIKEREAVFFIEDNKKYIIIDKNGIVLEVRDNIDNMKLTRLEGLDVGNIKLGEELSSANKRQIDNITNITELINVNSSGIEITKVNLSDSENVQIYCGNLLLKLGPSDLKDKLNLALNIIVSGNLKNAKGYIDVSVDGNPVVYTDK